MPFPCRSRLTPTSPTSRSRLLPTLAAGVTVLALLAGVGPARADGGPGAGDAAAPSAAPAAPARAAEDDVDLAVDPDQVLERAEAVLEPVEPVEPEPAQPAQPTEPTPPPLVPEPGQEAAAEPSDEPVDASMALRDVFLARPTLEGDDADRAESLLARPTDRGRDPLGNGYTAPSSRVCGPRVCVHHVSRGEDAPPDAAWVRTTLSVMDRVWRHHVGALGYRRPLRDGDRGGDGRFDVYLKELGSRGLYGYCAADRPGATAVKRAPTYCVLDNDFARSQFGRAPVQSLRVTAAHEFFHAVQFAYDITEDLWLLESTATWMEEKFADDVNDNRAYLKYGQVRTPGGSFDLFNPYGFQHYANWPLWEHLTRRFGVGIVRQVFNRVGAGGGLPDRSSVEGLREVLTRKPGGLPGVLARYFAANAAPAASYPEGRTWPTPRLVANRTLTPQQPTLQRGTSINHLASQHVRVVPGRTLGKRGRLAIEVNAPSGPRYVAFVTVLRSGAAPLRRRLALDPTGRGSATVAFPTGGARAALVTLGNVSTRYLCDQGTDYACRGQALDDRQRFVVRLTAYRGR